MFAHKIIKDIRFWIILFCVVRLAGITNPPLEVAHNWRQTTVTMVSRNFLETDHNIFYPRIDIAGEKSGITGMEFPLLNYCIYIAAELFGYQHWYGRIINLVVSGFGLWFFYKLVRKYFSEQTAFYAAIILAVSIWFQFSRKIMPDTFSMSMVLAAIYFGSHYLDKKYRKNGLWNLAGYALLVSLGVLSKLPSGYLLIVMGLFFFNREIPVRRKVIFSFATLLALLPVMAWYYFWVPYLVEKYGFWHYFMGKDPGQGIREIFANLNQTFSRFYDTALKFTGFAVFIYGLAYSIVKNDRRVYSIFLLTFSGFCVIIFKAGYTFPHHSYYIIPFVPVMALVAGYGLSKIKSAKIALLILVAISVEGIANQQHDFRVKENDRKMLFLEKDLDKVSRRDDLVLINSGDYPTPMYFAHRKGWVNSNAKISDPVYVDSLKTRGLQYIIILKRSFGTEISLPVYQKVLENGDYCIYKL